MKRETSLTVFKALHQTFVPDLGLPESSVTVLRKAVASRHGDAARDAALAFDRHHPTLEFRLEDGSTIAPHPAALAPTEVPRPEAEPPVAPSAPTVASVAAEHHLNEPRLQLIVENLRAGHGRTAIYKHYRWLNDEQFETYMTAAYRLEPPKGKFPSHLPVTSPPVNRPLAEAAPVTEDPDAALDALVQVIANVQNKRNVLSFKVGELTTRVGDLEKRVVVLQAERDAAVVEAENYRKMADEALALLGDPVMALTRMAGDSTTKQGVERALQAATRLRAGLSLREEITNLSARIPN